ncbi:CDP-glycerol glycerophosphotransferase family protein [Bacillus anthracis]|uniref:CDP-glycerol glycerophosphotransferase family protein n=1 Tax=Bacillus anthracis TaxID=1392 RepID=UPI001D0EFE59|nr:CDP-glycerol glycerophosphotransferase family protein [Bacillus anthracis]MCC2344178.1 CDP-glycerol glycerophosphotransferase family protein [Bacillus anthracis]
MYKLYKNIIEVIDVNFLHMHLYVKSLNTGIKLKIEDLKLDLPKFLFEYEIRDQIIFEYKLAEEYYIYIYALNNNIYILKEKEKKKGSSPREDIYNFDVKNFKRNLLVRQKGLTRLEIIDRSQNEVITVDNFLTTEVINFNVGYEIGIGNENKRFILISKVSYDIYNIIVTYDSLKKEFNVFKILFNTLVEHPSMKIEIRNRNEIFVRNKLTGTRKVLNFKRLSLKKPKKLFGKESVKNFKEENILSICVINGARYYIYMKQNGIFALRSNPLAVTQHKANLKVFSTKKFCYIYGRFTHHAYNSFRKYDYLYLRNSDFQIAKFIRPFSHIKFLKRFGFFRVPLSNFDIDERIHNNLFVGNEDRLIHNLSFKKNDEKVKTYIFKKHKDQLQVIRTNLQGNITSTRIPYAPEYSLTSRIKIKVAKFVSKFFKNKKKNLNLYFEKKSNKADESAYRVFEHIMNLDTPKSINYFILNKESNHYKYMKQQHGSNIIKKYSFKHYLSIYNADYFISSELSNHLLNDRLYIDSLRNKIMEVPLIFLQHGIMFAKPVDNPMAFGFHKDKNLYNMYKSVISSELEAKEFYKMQYNRNDLILTGLATFDFAKLAPDADKIAYMPTYRYWEEGLIYCDSIEETSYYKAIMKVIKGFEAAGLIDRLLIVPHNKFSEFIYRNMPEYNHIISDNPSEALKVSKVFITDYSSAIYDAQYRGAYPIFYWEEKDYLIQQYKAIPPVNESNSPGPVVYNIDELISVVNDAIKNDYKIDRRYKKRYSRINKFKDGKNTNRIVRFLKEDNII